MHRRVAEKYILDLLIWVVALPLAYLIRLEEHAVGYGGEIVRAVLLTLPFNALLIALLGLPRRSWHRMGLWDLLVLVAYALLGAIPTFSITLLSLLDVFMPRSVPVIAAMLALILMSSLRLASRLFHEQNSTLSKKRREKVSRVLIVGAGEAGIMFAREMLRHPRANCFPVGFLDDDPLKRRQRFLGLRVLGRIDDLPRVAAQCHVDQILIAIPSAPGEVVRRVVALARKAGVSHRIIPGIFDLISGKVAISQIREVDVEDLLRRDPVRLDVEQICEFVRGKVVLVTGAGGSIGSELVRQVARFDPATIVLLGRGENSIFNIDRELHVSFPHLVRHCVIADVRDRATLQQVFERFRPQVVFHAAAHKHVPLMEANPAQAIFNNIGGSANMAELALEFGVERFVNVSTDKAVNPTSIMGASKRVAELVVHRAAQKCTRDQSFVSVRFGNVLGSRGSVIPTFKEQIRRGGPITVTHPDMQRYFMTIPEASQLVIQAGSMAQNGSVYVLDMGEPVRIVDLARDLILLSGLSQDEIEIKYSGVRPGEKLYEEILTAEEGVESSRHEKIYVAKKRGLPEAKLNVLLEQLFAAAQANDEADIRRVLSQIIPTCKFEGMEREIQTPELLQVTA